MTAIFSSNPRWRRAAFPAACFAVVCAGLVAAAARPDEPQSDTVGVIDGEAIDVTGPTSTETVDGQMKTVLRSGSDVRVKSGTARINLVEGGGQVTICGAAHISVLKSGGSLTIALDTGTVHVRVERELPLAIYTPLIQAQTVAIGDGPRDALVGFDPSGAMCIRANLGAVRVEQQLTGQNILLPQTGDIFLFNGQLDHLRTSAGHCACELQVAKATPAPQLESSQPAAAEEARQKAADSKPDAQPVIVELPTSKEEPIYQVFVPPLIYNANAEVQPEIDPKFMFLVRRVRVRPGLIFQGRVEGGASVAASAPAPAPASAPVAADPPKAPAPAAASDSFVDRVRHFVRKHWPTGS